jgi:hypothetical protein
MAKVSRDLPFEKPFNPVGTITCVAAGGVKLEDLLGIKFPGRLDQADIEGLGIGVLPDLCLPVLPPGEAFSELIGTAAEHHDLIAGKVVSYVAFDKTVNWFELRSPAVRINDPGIPLLILTGNIGTNGGSQVDNRLSPTGEFVADH